MSPAEAELHEKVLISAGIRECTDCNGSGQLHGKVIRNYTTRAQYEEDIEYPCNNCDGTGAIPMNRFFASLNQRELAVWDV